MRIINKRVDDLIPYAKNPRNNKKAVDKVANSIAEFGFKVPLVVDINNVVICGHTRLLASKKLGLDEVPCIIADDLSEEQIKAFRLVDNKVSEASEWDYDLLDEELSEIFSIDMEEFGFKFFDPEEQHKEEKEKTQKRVANILNLEIAQFEGVGKYDIPEIQPIYELPKVKEWIGFNYVMSDKEPEGKGVHFFVDDYQFMRVWNNPDGYVEKLKKYAVVLTPDFSPYGDMPLATQIFNHYRKHWVGAYLQSRGVNIVPTVRASTDERSLEFYLEGEPKGGIVCISSMWVNKSKELKEYFMREYELMYNTLKPCKVLVYGSKIDGLKGDIEYIETFTSKRWGDKENG